MEKFSFLPILGALAIYLKWNYASPVGGMAERHSRFWLIRSLPLLMVLCSGILFTISLYVREFLWFYFFVMGVVTLLTVPFIVYITRRT
ncbi:MAG TPA: hypothetical protein VF680_10265 [Allosphingosinicella sp.]|jgi:hypothetical protein